MDTHADRRKTRWTPEKRAEQRERIKAAWDRRRELAERLANAPEKISDPVEAVISEPASILPIKPNPEHQWFEVSVWLNNMIRYVQDTCGDFKVNWSSAELSMAETVAKRWQRYGYKTEIMRCWDDDGHIRRRRL
jgi:hypothetical protein